MKEVQEVIIDQDGIELVVTYLMGGYESHEEEGHGYHDKGGFDFELRSVELIIANTSIDVLPQLTPKQMSVIIDALSIH